MLGYKLHIAPVGGNRNDVGQHRALRANVVENDSGFLQRDLALHFLAQLFQRPQLGNGLGQPGLGVGHFHFAGAIL